MKKTIRKKYAEDILNALNKSSGVLIIQGTNDWDMSLPTEKRPFDEAIPPDWGSTLLDTFQEIRNLKMAFNNHHEILFQTLEHMQTLQKQVINLQKIVSDLSDRTKWEPSEN